MILVSNVDLSVDFWVGVIRHPQHILEFKWLNYTSRLKRRRWCRLIRSETVHEQLSES
jgi:hypothetical protein